MRNAFWLFVAALAVVLLAGTALAESETAYECTNPNGSTFTVEDPAECDISETPPTWAVGANGSTSFRVVETTYVMLGTDTVELFPYKAECDVEEQVIMMRGCQGSLLSGGHGPAPEDRLGTVEHYGEGRLEPWVASRSAHSLSIQVGVAVRGEMTVVSWKFTNTNLDFRSTPAARMTGRSSGVVTRT